MSLIDLRMHADGKMEKTPFEIEKLTYGIKLDSKKTKFSS